MTRDDVIRMARDAGIQKWWDTPNARQDTYEAALEHFAELVAKHEREACAAICDRFALRNMHPAECAAAIRARGES